MEHPLLALYDLELETEWVPLKAISHPRHPGTSMIPLILTPLASAYPILISSNGSG